MPAGTHCGQSLWARRARFTWNHSYAPKSIPPKYEGARHHPMENPHPRASRKSFPYRVFRTAQERSEDQLHLDSSRYAKTAGSSPKEHWSADPRRRPCSALLPARFATALPVSRSARTRDRPVGQSISVSAQAAFTPPQEVARASSHIPCRMNAYRATKRPFGNHPHLIYPGLSA